MKQMNLTGLSAVAECVIIQVVCDQCQRASDAEPMKRPVLKRDFKTHRERMAIFGWDRRHLKSDRPMQDLCPECVRRLMRRSREE